MPFYNSDIKYLRTGKTREEYVILQITEEKHRIMLAQW
jgi:hypothetical protein